MTKFIAVTGHKGGTGKTTVSFHLAAYFAQKGKTLLVDSDPARAALKWRDRANRPLSFEVAGDKAADRLITGCAYVIYDTPARTNELKEIAQGADLLILPCAPSPLDLVAMIDTAKDIQGANYRALVSIVPPLPSKEGEKMRQDLKDSHIPVFASMVRRSSVFVKAAMFGLPISELGGVRFRNAWQDFTTLGKEIERLIK